MAIADAAVSGTKAVALALAAAAVADAVAAGLGDAEMIVSDPGPVSGTGTGRVAELRLGSLEPVKESPPDPPSHSAKPMRPTPTAPANNQRFDLDAAFAPGDVTFSDGLPDSAASACAAGTELPSPENSGSSNAENSTRSCECGERPAARARRVTPIREALGDVGRRG